MSNLYKDDFLLKIFKNKKVLDIGAADYPYHIKKLKEKKLLYFKLQSVCKSLTGIDVNRKAIKQLKIRNVKNIFYGDIEKGVFDINIKNMQFDYILLADVIEHLNNPGIALRSIKRLMKKNTLLIITTPNVFSYRNIKTFLSGKEVVHPDHTFWPSVKTMKKLFANNGFKIKSYFYCFWGSYKDKKTINRVFSRVLAKLFPHLLPCLCFILKGN